MSVIPQEVVARDLENGKLALQQCLQFIRDNEFYERLVDNPDWLKAKEGLTNEKKELINKQDALLELLVKAAGSRKIDIQDGILECAIRLDQANGFLGWFEEKVKQLKLAREQLPLIKEKIAKLQESLNG